MRETAGLTAIAKNSQGLPGKCLLNEGRQDHPVAPSLPRTDSIEQPDNGDRKPALAMVSQRQELINRLGARIAPAPFRGWPKHEVVLFREGKLGGLAVNFGGGGDQHAF